LGLTRVLVNSPERSKRGIKLHALRPERDLVEKDFRPKGPHERTTTETGKKKGEKFSEKSSKGLKKKTCLRDWPTRQRKRGGKMGRMVTIVKKVQTSMELWCRMATRIQGRLETGCPVIDKRFLIKW